MAKRRQGFLHSFYFFFLVHLTLMEPFPNKKKHVLVLKLRLEQKQTKSTLFLLFVKLTLSFDWKQKWQDNNTFWLQLKTSCFQTKRKKNNYNLLRKGKTHPNLLNERNCGSEITNIWREKYKSFCFFDSTTIFVCFPKFASTKSSTLPTSTIELTKSSHFETNQT